MRTDKREDLRNECRIPLEVICNRNDCFFQGTACNISSTGMCFLSDLFLKYGEPIYLKTLNRGRSEDFSVYVARVQWSSKIFDEQPMYRVGIRYTAKGQLMLKDRMLKWPVRCELCGKETMRDFHETDNLLLCWRCFRNMGGYDDENINKQSILRFLQGNVI